MESEQNALEIYDKYTSIPCYIVAMSYKAETKCAPPLMA